MTLFKGKHFERTVRIYKKDVNLFTETLQGNTPAKENGCSCRHAAKAGSSAGLALHAGDLSETGVCAGRFPCRKGLLHKRLWDIMGGRSA